MLERLTLTDFTPCVGQVYRLALDEQSIVVVLREARAIGAAPIGPGTRVPFSLEFETEGPMRLGQGTYGLTFPDGTRTEVFLVPIQATPQGGVRLQAVFT